MLKFSETELEFANNTDLILELVQIAMQPKRRRKSLKSYAENVIAELGKRSLVYEEDLQDAFFQITGGIDNA